MKQPLVSICMSAFNTEDYIHEAILSVINQTYQNIELLITDDASSDGTADIISYYVSQDPRVKAIFLPVNAGMNSAISNMYSIAKGSFLGSVDSDDKIKPLCIEKCVEVLQSQSDDVGMVYTHSEYFGARKGKTFFNSEPYSKELFLRYLPTFHFRLFKADLWQHIKQFNLEWDGSYDVELSMRLSLVTEFIELPEILYCWRQHSQQHHRSEESKKSFKLIKDWYKHELKRLECLK